MEHMYAGNMKRSSIVKTRAGMSLRLSEPVAVCHSATATEKRSFVAGLEPTPEAVTVLTAMLIGLLRNTLSGDVVALSMYSAKHMSEEAGVSEDEFKRVSDVIVKKWAELKSQNPLSTMF